MQAIKIDKKELKLQIKAVLKSDMPERYKEGVHNLLGTILDNELDKERYDKESLDIGNVIDAKDVKDLKRTD